MRLIRHDAWLAEGARCFGGQVLAWRFVCPSCGYICTIADWKEHGAPEAEIAFVCLGTRKGAAHYATLRHQGGPCHYRGDGLFRLNPVRVLFEDGTQRDLFEFAPAPLTEEAQGAS